MCTLCSRHGCVRLIFFFKQKTAYEMRISDWSSDVCSSDLLDDATLVNGIAQVAPFDAAAKQALLEASPVDARAELVVQLMQFFEIGRASCRERVCQYV